MRRLLRPTRERRAELEAAVDVAWEKHRPAIEETWRRAHTAGEERRRQIASICDPSLRRSARN